jgi:radical S-adenosyl methionine domain-containing protein 2
MQQDNEIGFVPVSVNFFLSRECNYRCSYCFHTQTSDYVMRLRDIQHGLTLLRDAGMRKLNFTGGEPFLHAHTVLGPLVAFCKTDLDLESVSIVSNGSRVTRDWFEEYGAFLDILAISCDSFVPRCNANMGRGDGGIVHRVEQIAAWCREFHVKMKLNTVVCLLNWQEDMNARVSRIDPFRWKCFQLLIIEGENAGGVMDQRDARGLAITDAQFEQFLDRHRKQKAFVPENNRLMRNSYLLLDERMRFLNCQGGKKEPTKSILDVGVVDALKESGFCPTTFEQRGGIYQWTRDVRI